VTTLYLSGPMSGYPSYNFPAFFAAARSLTACGYTVLNPAEFHAEVMEEIPWSVHMRRDLVAMLTSAEGLALLPNHHLSKGAQLETYVAAALGMKCQLVERWIEDAG
jgi:hypothetical protein